jgi:NTE family protein
MDRRQPLTGLVLSGGGARAAYQVGVLQAVAELRRELGQETPRALPFRVLTGTSAGAINAVALASHADDFQAGVDLLVRVWSGFHADQVYRSDAMGVMETGARWLGGFAFGWLLKGLVRARPKSLLDNAPLGKLLGTAIDYRRITEHLRSGNLSALAVCASSYSSGRHVTFYQSRRQIAGWTRSQRLAIRERIGARHLLASSAIPFVFPAQSLRIGHGEEYFGDGSMRQVAPISPAIHLGASRILVIGVGRTHQADDNRPPLAPYPSLAQVAGHALSSIFLDSLAADVERLERVNRTLSLLDVDARAHSPLKPIDILVISPSQRLDDLAGRHVGELPRPVRTMLAALGVVPRSGRRRRTRPGAAAARGATLASYLLFEQGYTRELIALGIADVAARRAEVLSFLAADAEGAAARAARSAVHTPY